MITRNRELKNFETEKTSSCINAAKLFNYMCVKNWQNKPKNKVFIVHFSRIIAPSQFFEISSVILLHLGESIETLARTQILYHNAPL